MTIEEEEEQEGGSLFERQQQQQQRQRCSNRASTATTCNEEPHGSPKPRTAAAAASSTSGKPQGLECKATASETTTPARVRGKGANAATSSPSSRRAATAPTKPREVVVGRDYSLGRQPLPPPDAAPGAPGAAAPEKTARDPAKAAAAGAGRGGFRGNKAIVVQTRGGGEAVVVVPKRPRPIWFAGSGAIQAEWSALPGGARVARDLEGLEEQGRYHVCRQKSDREPSRTWLAHDHAFCSRTDRSHDKRCKKAMQNSLSPRFWGIISRCRTFSSVSLSCCV